MKKLRIPLPKQTEQVFRDKKKYCRRDNKEVIKSRDDDPIPGKVEKKCRPNR